LTEAKAEEKTVFSGREKKRQKVSPCPGCTPVLTIRPPRKDGPWSRKQDSTNTRLTLDCKGSCLASNAKLSHEEMVRAGKARRRQNVDLLSGGWWERWHQPRRRAAITDTCGPKGQQQKKKDRRTRKVTARTILFEGTASHQQRGRPVFCPRGWTGSRGKRWCKQQGPASSRFNSSEGRTGGSRTPFEPLGFKQKRRGQLKRPAGKGKTLSGGEPMGGSSLPVRGAARDWGHKKRYGNRRRLGG